MLETARKWPGKVCSFTLYFSTMNGRLEPPFGLSSDVSRDKSADKNRQE